MAIFKGKWKLVNSVGEVLISGLYYDEAVAELNWKKRANCADGISIEPMRKRKE